MDEKYDGVKDWDNVLEHYAKLNRYYEDSRNTLASEILADNDKKDARKNKIIFSLVAIIVFLIVGLIALNIYWIYQWNSYDYVSQDGEGYNYYNADVEGDVMNGADN